MELKEFDRSARKTPYPVRGSEYQVDLDMIIKAVLVLLWAGAANQLRFAVPSASEVVKQAGKRYLRPLSREATSPIITTASAASMASWNPPTVDSFWITSSASP